VQESHYLRCK